MPTPTEQRYLIRIQRVREHIDDHIDEPLDLGALSEIACLSRFHWTRIYQAMTGETPVEAVRRLRLERAAIELVRGEPDLHGLAIKSGYTWQAACRARHRNLPAPADLIEATSRRQGQLALKDAFIDQVPQRFTAKIMLQIRQKCRIGAVHRAGRV
jgi:transcriptional regulator GlxA family with amidase domain